MKFKYLIILFIFSSFIYFGEDLLFFINKNLFNPCNKPIIYTLGEIDPSFGLSNDEAILALKKSEDKWEKAIQKNLFDYGEKGMEVNFVYDYRQEATLEIENIDSVYEEDSYKYEKLEEEYNQNLIIYNSKKDELDQLALIYNQKSLDYKKEVSSFNKSFKNYSQDKYDQLVSEKETLEEMLNQIKIKQEEINKISNYINYLVPKINELAASLNINADKYNNVVDSLEYEFEQGSYISQLGSKEINIYQFTNEENLVQVLTHELGHSLGLDHSINSNDIMYWLNSGESQFITEESLSKLKNICYLK